MAANVIYMGARVFGALMMGALLGLIPAILGVKRNKKGLALAGFLCCVFGSFLFGLFLSVPSCVVFTVIILVTSSKS